MTICDRCGKPAARIVINVAAQTGGERIILNQNTKATDLCQKCFDGLAQHVTGFLSDKLPVAK